MELREGTRRIFGQHWRLIVAFVAAGLALGVLAHVGATRTYTASTRLALDTQDPKTQAESTAIADTADAIATSPALVARALANAHVRDRDAARIASGHVSTRSLGTSGILQLSVSDRDPRVASAVANALAAGVIQTRLEVTRGTTNQAVTDLDQRIARLSEQISGLDAKIAGLNVRAATTANPLAANALRARRDDSSRRRDFLTEQRAVFETERATVVSGDALQPRPTIISPAIPPTHPDSSGATADVVLGLLLGAILGVGVAALLETVRPTVVGGEALATKFDTPLLGSLLEGPDGRPPLAEMAGIADRLRLVASAEHVRTIGLLPVDDGIDVESLSRDLDAFIGAPDFRETDEYDLVGVTSARQSGQRRRGGRLAARDDQLRIRPFDSRSFAAGNGHRNGNGNGSGLVLVCPPVLKEGAFTAASHLLRINPGRLIGLIAYSTQASRHDSSSIARGDDV